MRLDHLDAAAAKLILKTSEGFGSQSPAARARPFNGALRPSRPGHPLSDHLRGAGGRDYKTRFCSLDDMANALVAVLATRGGAAIVASLRPGTRGDPIKETIAQLYPIEAELQGVPKLRAVFSAADLRAAGFTGTRCVAIVDDRTRGSQEYLHVQSFYPALESADIWRLFELKTKP